MIKRSLPAGVAIFVAWTVIDVALLRLLLAPRYQENPSLWRLQDKLNVPLICLVTITLTGCFASMYRFLVRPRSLCAGVRFGSLMGVALGIAIGIGTYIHMPIPLVAAWGWLRGVFLTAVVAGAIFGLLVSEPATGEAWASPAREP
jgi:hypothetical protein